MKMKLTGAIIFGAIWAAALHFGGEVYGQAVLFGAVVSLILWGDQVAWWVNRLEARIQELENLRR